MYILALLLGIIAGLRALTPVAAVCWAAHLGWLHLADTPLAFLGSTPAVCISSLLALGELVNDKLPKTPSRKAPPSFIARLVMGGLSGAAAGIAAQTWIATLVLGVIGAVLGTLGGYEFRKRLVQATGGKDLPIALLEDAIAVGGAFLLLSQLS